MSQVRLFSTILSFFLSLCLYSNTIEINTKIDKDTTLSVFGMRELSYKVSIKMKMETASDDFLVRVILVDNTGKRYLVAEEYNALMKSGETRYADYSEETYLLDGITPVCLKIYTKKATVYLQEINNSTTPPVKFLNADDIRDISQTNRIKEKVLRINDYNSKHHKLWTAGITSLSLMSYEDRMRVLGFSDEDYTYGIEYYSGGIFEIGERNENCVNDGLRSDTTYVDKFDWTNRHGKNWITPVKHQGNSGFCASFSTIACAEALTNLYYNQKIDLDLSELEAISCCNHGSWDIWKLGVSPSNIADYLINHGVCDETAYPFLNDSCDVNCRSAEVSPSYILKIHGHTEGNGYISYYSQSSIDSIKRRLILHGPFVSGITSTIPPRSHAMLLVGFGTIHEGDSIKVFVRDSLDVISTNYYPIPACSPLIGKTYWKFKNSHGLGSDDDNNGYMYILYHDPCWMNFPIHYLDYPFQITLETTNQPMFTDADIVCNDEDGDGYFFWGLGGRPANCPSWIPEEPDGDDSNPLKGKMYRNPFGELESLNPDNSSAITISGNTTYSTKQSCYSHIRILSNAKLTIQNTLNLFGRVNITIDAGGELIIDGGLITNVNINLVAGSKLTIKNGGTMVMRTNTDFVAPVGALVDVIGGQIIIPDFFN